MTRLFNPGIVSRINTTDESKNLTHDELKDLLQATTKKVLKSKRELLVILIRTCGNQLLIMLLRKERTEALVKKQGEKVTGAGGKAVRRVTERLHLSVFFPHQTLKGLFDRT